MAAAFNGKGPWEYAVPTSLERGQLFQQADPGYGGHGEGEDSMYSDSEYTESYGGDEEYGPIYVYFSGDPTDDDYCDSDEEMEDTDEDGASEGPRGAVSISTGARTGARAAAHHSAAEPGGDPRGNSSASNVVRVEATAGEGRGGTAAVGAAGLASGGNTADLRNSHGTEAQARVVSAQAAVARPAPAPTAAVARSVPAPTDAAGQRLASATAAVAVPRAMPAPAAAAAGAPMAQGGLRGPVAGLKTLPGGGAAVGAPAATGAGATGGMPGLQAAGAAQTFGLPLGQVALLQLAAAQQALLLGALASSARGVVPSAVGSFPAAWHAMAGAPLAHGAGNALGGLSGALGAATLLAPSRFPAAAANPIGEAVQIHRNIASGALRRAHGIAAAVVGGGGAAAGNAIAGAAGGGGAEDACAQCGRRGCEGGFWIACDSCDSWYCGRCAKMNGAKAAKVKKWFCFDCTSV